MDLRLPRFMHWYSPAAFEGENDRRTARVLVWLIVVSWGVYLLVSLVSWSYRDWQNTAVTCAVIVLQVVPLWLIRRGHLRLSAFIFLLGVLTAITCMATFGQGITDIGVVAYPILLVFAGSTLSRRLFLGCVGLTVAAVIWLAAGQAAGAYVTKPLTTSIWVYTIGVVAVLLVGAFAVYMLSADLQRSLASARKELARRRQTETALQESEERFRFLSSMTAEGIAIHDNGILLDANQAFANLAGFKSPSELIGEPIFEMVPFTPESLRILEQRRLAPSNDAYEVEILAPDGSKRTLETSARQVTYLGRPARLISSLEITARKRAEEALRASEEQLRQSQKMEAVGQLAGGIAHDFNNLLFAILGYSELLLADSEAMSSKARQDLLEIMKAAERGSSLTKQILAFSRRQALRPTSVSLNDILDKMESLLRRSLGEDVELVMVHDPGLWTVEADVHQFEQVVMNLAVNARDAMPTGGRLTMQTANVELHEEFCNAQQWVSPGSHVMLRVSDTGVGMDEATLMRVFEPFFTTKEVGKGTGLGLAVAYGIVKQSGGSIYVESEPGVGTTFTIYLPRVTVYAADEEQPSHEMVQPRGTETILLVEDETAVRELVARVLIDLGYRVISAGSVEEARQAADHAGKLHLLLTDVVLPGQMQGNDLAHELTSPRPDLPVIYISGYSRDALVHAGRLDAGVHLLEKPFTSQALVTLVRRVLDRRRGGD